jgi:hypothetical protein
MGQNKFALQFTQLGKNVANYLQRTVASEGYSVADMMHTGKKQVIELLAAIDLNYLECAGKIIIRAKEVKAIAKRHLKLKYSLKKGYATVYNQCLQEVQDKLKSTDD